jgi:hypothetical protein
MCVELINRFGSAGASLTVDYTNAMIFDITPTVPITSLTITGIPTPATSYVSYTFTFILHTSAMTNYITATQVMINSTNYALLGNANIAGNLAASNPTMIIQQVTALLLNGVFTAFTSASAF